MFHLPQISPEARAAARLASGQPIWLHHGGYYYWLLAAEGASPASLPGTGGQLILTSHRAQALGAETSGELIMLKLPARADTLEALINPLKISASVILADFDVQPVALDHPAHHAMALVKQTGLLPALIIGPRANKPPADALIYETRVRPAFYLTRISQSKLPLRAAPDSNVITFRDQHGATHLAIMVGEPDMDMPLVRVHSSCLTGDILGSLRCDCGDQLQAALTMMHETGGGILLYLDQEGRGIGLANKLRAYQLQDGGMNTYEANNALGFADDERNFDLAASVLRELSIYAVRLLTNNPSKVDKLSDAGILVKERVPLIIMENPHNQAYLNTKEEQGGHIFG